jgi:tetratricopeptide (TPR) repeat protein
MKQFFISLFQSKKDSEQSLFGNIFLGIILFIAPISFLLLKLSGISSLPGLLFTGIVWSGLLYLLIMVIVQGKFLLPKRYSFYSIIAIIFYTIFQVVAFSSVHFSFGTTASLLDHPLMIVSLFMFVVIVGLVSVGHSFLRSFLYVLASLISVVIVHTLIVGISGWQFLSLGFSPASGMHIFGSWTDLGIISFLLLIGSFIYSFFTEDSFQKKSMWVFGAIGFLGMAFTNMYLGWVLLGLFSLGAIFIAFFHAQNNLQSLLKRNTAPFIPVVLFLISLIFIIGYSFISGPIRSLSGVSSEIIRLSPGATYDIVTNLSVSQMIVGSGLGTFENVWFQHMDPAVLQTPLWNTGFSFAFGYLPTFLITFGILGVLLLLAFFAMVFAEGYQSLIHSRKEDRGIISILYVVALFSLPLLVFSIPNLSVIILLLLSIGLLLGFSYGAPKQMHTSDIFSFHAVWKRFVSVGIVLCLVAVCVYVLFAHVRYVSSLRMIQKATIVLNDATPEEAMNYIYRAQSYAGNNYDVHMMVAQASLVILQSSNQEKVTPEFVQNILQVSLGSLQKAISIQSKKHQPYILFGDIHTFLANAGLPEALPIAKEAYQKSLEFRPLNPYVLLVQATDMFTNGAVEEGRLKLDELFKMHSFNASFFQEAGLLEEKFGSLIRAEAYFKQSVFLERNQLDVWTGLVSFYARTGSLDKAQEALEFLVKEYPQNINVRILIARYFVETGNRIAAQEHIDFLKQYEDESSDLKQFLINLQNSTAVIPEIIEVDDASLDSEQTSEEQITESEL